MCLERSGTKPLKMVTCGWFRNLRVREGLVASAIGCSLDKKFPLAGRWQEEHSKIRNYWSGREDSNLRPLPPEYGDHQRTRCFFVVSPIDRTAFERTVSRCVLGSRFNLNRRPLSFRMRKIGETRWRPPDIQRKRKTAGGTAIPTSGEFHSYRAISSFYGSVESGARANLAGGAS